MLNPRPLQLLQMVVLGLLMLLSLNGRERKPRGISGTASASQDRPPANAGGMGWVEVKRGSLIDHIERSLVANESR
jgi:hypothetical protein